MLTYKKDNFKIPIKSWIPEEQYYLDKAMVEQCENLAQLPFAFHHIALMPDGHLGYGMPIGGVMVTKDVIVPNAAGVDLGCGVCAVKTSLTEIDIETLKKIMGEIRKVIPVGFEHHQKIQDYKYMPERKGYVRDGKHDIVLKEWNNALTQIGSLGGGNHFISIEKGSDKHIWIMIHSGSRNLGFQVANYYNKIAIELNKKWHSQIPKQWELAFLPVDSEEGQAYLREMQYCVDFALANRKLMMERITDIFMKTFYDEIGFYCKNCEFGDSEEMINIAHNYISLENHFGENVFVHRKGATLAREGTIGIIPGSQGSPSFIVKGLGNKESFESCAHGAGRKMGRKEAIKTLDLEKEKERLNNMGVIHTIRRAQDLDEAPSAYKDISEVMNNQTDLVKILVELIPLAVIKG